MTSVTDFDHVELRKLRYRLGWSQAEMARNLNLDLMAIAGFERGSDAIPASLVGSLIRIAQTADANADSCQRRALAETLMDERNLAQIHNFDCDADAVGAKGRA